MNPKQPDSNVQKVYHDLGLCSFQSQFDLSSVKAINCTAYDRLSETLFMAEARLYMDHNFRKTLILANCPATGQLKGILVPIVVDCELATYAKLSSANFQDELTFAPEATCARCRSTKPGNG